MESALATMNGEVMPRLSEGNALAEQYPVDKPAMETALAKTHQNLIDISKTKKIFQRSHSNFQWRALVLTHEDDLMNIEQVNNELTNRQDALIENLFLFEDKSLEADELDEEAALGENKDRPAKRKRLTAKAAKIRKQARMAYAPVMGCLKDIDYLTMWYKKLESKIIKDHGKFDETIREKLQEKYYIKRLLRQALQNIRADMRNQIDVGNQRALEQIGIDPTWAEKQLNIILTVQKAYHQGIEEGAESDCSSALVEFKLDQLAEGCTGVHGAKLKRMELETEDKTMLYVEQ